MRTFVLTLMPFPVTLPGLAAFLLICCGVFLLVKVWRMQPQRPGVEPDSKSTKEEQPDGAGGIVAVILCIAFIALLIIVPARKGASPGSQFYLAGLSLCGIGWGVRQIRLARAQDKRDSESAKKRDDAA